MGVALRALTACWKAKGGYYFHEPVDVASFGISDYFEIIKEPMDFGTVKKKLTYNVYNSVQEFVSDMHLVFDNCIKYNGVENQVAQFALNIKGTFESIIKEVYP